MDHDYLKDMLINGFSRFYSEGYRVWSKKTVEGALKATGIQKPIEDPYFQSILQEMESRGYIKLLYNDDRYLEVFDIDQIQMRQKKTP